MKLVSVKSLVITEIKTGRIIMTFKYSFKYYGKDLTIGHRDDPFFEVEVNDDRSPTGKKYVAFRLVDIDGGKLMPEEIHDYIAANIITKVIRAH